MGKGLSEVLEITGGLSAAFNAHQKSIFIVLCISYARKLGISLVKKPKISKTSAYLLAMLR